MSLYMVLLSEMLKSRRCVLCSNTVMRETTKRLTVNICHGIVLRYTGRKLLQTLSVFGFLLHVHLEFYFSQF